MTLPVTERRILLIIAAVQFVNILDFMIVMPLGPDFAAALGIPLSQLGLVGGSYTAAAAISGVLGALVLDRFDRRKALAVTLGGLVMGTLAGGFATGLGTMLAARVLAGTFGGPAAALSLAIVTDVVPPERRGRAMGLVMASFSAASVLGVPVGLELARLGGWRLPFFGVSGVGIVLAVIAIAMLPPLTGHLTARPHARGHLGDFLRRPTVLMSLAATAAVMVGNFVLIPNLAAYWQFNFGYPRERLGLLYLVGGLLSFVTMPLAGRLCDRFGATGLATAGTLIYVAILFPSFIYPAYWIPVLLLFCAVMGSASFRMIPMQALGTRVPGADERARFMSTQSAVQHMAAAVGSVLGAQMLSELPTGALVGMDLVGWLAVALALLLPPLVWGVEVRVRRRERAEPSATARQVPAVADVT
jgi:predicted MFS family arabinose efflux permease